MHRPQNIHIAQKLNSSYSPVQCSRPYSSFARISDGAILVLPPGSRTTRLHNDHSESIHGHRHTENTLRSAFSENNTALSALSRHKRRNKGCDLERTTAHAAQGLMISPGSCLSMLFGSMTRQENTAGQRRNSRCHRRHKEMRIDSACGSMTASLRYN